MSSHTQIQINSFDNLLSVKQRIANANMVKVAYSNFFSYFKVTKVNQENPILDKIVEEYEIRQKQLLELKKNIGDALFNKLSDNERQWIIETEGSIDLGKPYTDKDFKKVFSFLRDYE